MSMTICVLVLIFKFYYEYLSVQINFAIDVLGVYPLLIRILRWRELINGFSIDGICAIQIQSRLSQIDVDGPFIIRVIKRPLKVILFNFDIGGISF